MSLKLCLSSAGWDVCGDSNVCGVEIGGKHNMLKELKEQYIMVIYKFHGSYMKVETAVDSNKGYVSIFKIPETDCLQMK